MQTMIPAFGADYKSEKEVYEALNANKEFELTGVNSNGGYVTKKELLEAGETKVLVRYRNKSRQGVFGLK